MLPLSGGYLGDGFVWPEGDSQPSDAGRPMVFLIAWAPVISKLWGRQCLRAENSQSATEKGHMQVAVVDETFARGFWPGERGDRQDSGQTAGMAH